MNHLLALLLIFYSVSLGRASRISEHWIIWNVGQGLWTTHINDHECVHIDAGGESKPLRAIQKLCSGKSNRLSLSHWDWDHIGGVGALRSVLPNLCLANAPGGKHKSAKRRKTVEALPACRPPGRDDLRELHWGRPSRSANGASRVWVWKNRWLFPGDSPSPDERKWARQIPNPARVQILIAGHHGSNTSTSQELLSVLPNLRLAIISARRKRYGHPHPGVLARLRKEKVPALLTEEWGHLIFEIGSDQDSENQ